MNRKQIAWIVLLGLLVVGSVLGRMVTRPGTDNLYVRQADAFLRGQLAIDESGWDAAVVNGRNFVAFPPAARTAQSADPEMALLVLTQIDLRINPERQTHRRTAQSRRKRPAACPG